MCEERVGVCNVAVHFIEHRVATVVEAVLLSANSLAVDDVADVSVTPELQAAGIDESVEDPVEQLVRLVGAGPADDVSAVRAHVVADAQDVVGVDGVVGNARGILSGHLSGLDEQGGVGDDQHAHAFGKGAEIERGLGGGHALLLR